MIQIFDIQVSSNETIQQAIMKIYGVGRGRSEQFCNHIGLPRSTKFRHLSHKKRSIIAKQLEDFIAEWQILIDIELRQTNNLAMTKLRSINSYRGIRNSQGLPVRGQSTKSNAKTQRKRRRATSKR